MTLLNAIRSAGDVFGLVARSRTIWFAIGATVLFWIAAYFAPFLPMYALISVTQIVVAFGVLLMYLPGALQAAVSRRITDGEQLVLGIWVAWFGDICLRIWALTQRALEQPAWMLTSDLVTYILFIKLMGATLHLTSPGLIDGRLPRDRWVWLSVGAVLGALVTVLLMATSLGVGLLKAL